MSRIGKQPIVYPASVKVHVADGKVRVEGPKGKTVFARVRVRRAEDGWRAASAGARGSNLFTSVARSNGLAVIPPGVDRIEAGSQCRVILFRSMED